MTDKQEFERIFRQYYGGMFRLARKMLGDEQESKDVVSDVFAQLLNSHTDLHSDTLHNETDKIYLQAQRFGSTVSPVYDVTEKHSSSRLGLLGQFTPIGIEIGSRLKVFGELGIGIQGVLNAGLRYSF